MVFLGNYILQEIKYESYVICEMDYQYIFENVLIRFVKEHSSIKVLGIDR